jgi:hypothetical protein
MTDQQEPIGSPSCEEAAEANRIRHAGAFDRRVQWVPADWRGPLIDVLDTYEAVRLKLLELHGFAQGDTCVDLTRLVLEEKARKAARAAQGEEV